MKRLLIVLLVLLNSTLLLTAQKSKVLGAFQLIEKEKFEEAKGIIEGAIKEKSTSDWPRTWYARGIICQNAYKVGMKKNDKNLYELYPNQLYVAFSSFEKTRYYDKRGFYDKSLAPKYVVLANDFTKSGEAHFKKKEYKEALRAFQYALRITQSSILSVSVDTSLIYNVALSAFKSRQWDEASKYLSKLNEASYSSNIAHLMFEMYMNQLDTTSAQKVLLDGIERYEDNEELVLLLGDLLYKKDDSEQAGRILDEAFARDSMNYIFPYTKGLLYQKIENYEYAVQAYKKALTIPSDTMKVYKGIGTSYFNIGVEIEEKSRTIQNNYEYMQEKQRSAEAFESALDWFEKAHNLEPEDKETVNKLQQLYRMLDKPRTSNMLAPF